MTANHVDEINSGDRFEFGANWRRFLSTMNEERIDRAVLSLQEKLGVQSLAGMRFLDIGSGSGLFSLAARRLGAYVHSFDYDPESVMCTRSLKSQFFADDNNWKIEEGSVLDPAYLSTLGTFDIVYSWGVLHHTGAMWEALENVCTSVAPDGKLFIAIYNDQGGQSRRWKKMKQIYNKLPTVFRPPYALLTMGSREVMFFLVQLFRGTPGNYTNNIKNYSTRSARGMSYWHDSIDWIGGYPFEVAKPEEIFNFYRDRNFTLIALRTRGGSIGCNEFIFYKSDQQHK